MRSPKTAFTIAVAAAVALPMMLGGCVDSTPKEPSSPPSASRTQIGDSMGYGVFAISAKGSKVGHDKDVHCVYVDSVRAGGLSCDWSGLNGQSLSTDGVTIKKVGDSIGYGTFAVNVKGSEFGRKKDVPCIYVDSVRAGGLSCDWSVPAPPKM